MPTSQILGERKYACLYFHYTVYDLEHRMSENNIYSTELKSLNITPGKYDFSLRWNGEGGGREVQDGEHIDNHGWFMSVYGKNHYNIVK